MQLTRRLDANHDMTFGGGLANFAVNTEATAQNVQTRLLMLQGEWFLNTTAGVPYTNNALTEAIIKQVILDTDGVDEITSFSLSFNHSTRVWSVSVAGTTDWSTQFSTQVNL